MTCLLPTTSKWPLTGLDAGAFAWVFVDKTPDGPRVTVAEPDAALLERGRVLRPGRWRVPPDAARLRGRDRLPDFDHPARAQPQEEMEGATS